jgi:TRAP-type C4-dicarboxylate transport system permease small subunit
MRNFFHLGYLWVDEGIRVMVLWLAFMGAGIASEYARHIRVDILMYALTERQKQIVDVLANIFIIGVCMGFLVAALRHIQFQMASTVQLVLTGVPDWATSLVIPYFFVITAFRALLHINRDLRGEKQEELPIAANESVAWGTGE